MALEISAATPLYIQLKAVLLREIESGNFAAGTQIPTEQQLSEKYGVSRITARHAVMDLVQEGYLERQRGKGTFVAKPRISRRLEYLMSFTESCQACGLKPSTKVLKRELVDPTPEDLSYFPQSKGQKMLHISRLRSVGRTPFIFENNYYPYPQYDFLEKEPLNESLYELLRTKYHTVVCASEDSYLEVVRAGAEVGNLLKVQPDEPLFYLYSLIYDENGHLVHIGKQYLVCARYRFYLSDFEK